MYLPPGYSPSTRYPVVYLLQGFRGSPYQFVFGVSLPTIADGLIARGAVSPFIAVMPPAGQTAAYRGEWTGAWEDELVHAVVPWVDAQLPAVPLPSGRIVAGLSAGGYGAVDIGLRHPSMFGTLESWSGSFTAPRDGSLRDAGAGELAAHDPSLIARREAPLLHQLGTRFFLSAGTADVADASAATSFAEELALLRLPHRFLLVAGRHNGRFWRSQLPAALEYALAAG